MFWTYVYVVLGGAIGTGFRFLISQCAANRWGESFPIGTLLINVGGSLVIGILAGLSDSEGRFVMGPLYRQFFMIGICGGFTTFSSFSLQTMNLLREGQWLYAWLYVLLSVSLSLGGVWIGLIVVQLINRLR